MENRSNRYHDANFESEKFVYLILLRHYERVFKYSYKIGSTPTIYKKFIKMMTKRLSMTKM